MKNIKKEFYRDFVNGEEVVRFAPKQFIDWIEQKKKQWQEEARKEVIKELECIFKDHYWDSLEQNKELILEHISAILYLEKKNQQD